MIARNGTSGKWDDFKDETARVQGQHVHVKVKGKAGRNRKPWMKKDSEALVEGGIRQVIKS